MTNQTWVYLRRALPGLVIALAVVAAGPAWGAEGPALDTLRYRISPLPGDILGVASATTHEKGVLGGAFSLQGEHNPVFLVVDPDRTDPVVGDRLVGELALSFGLGRGIAIWTGLPFVAYQSGWWPSPEEEIQSFGMGDIRLGAAFPLMDPEKQPVGISLRPTIQAPTGVRQAFASSGVVELIGNVGVETRALGPVRIAATMGARIGPPSDWVDVEVYSAFTYGLGVDVQVHRKWNVTGAWVGEVAGNEWENPMELRLGGSYSPTDGVDIGMTMGFGIVPGAGTPDFRLGFGVSLGVPLQKEEPAVIEVVEPSGPTYVPADVSAVETRSGYVEILLPSPVRFDEGETRLGKGAEAALIEIAEYLKRHPELRPILVLGHGDGSGGEEYDAALSLRRAVAARKYLVEKGGLVPELLTLPEANLLESPIEAPTGRRTAVAFIVSAGH